jgi:hypothetical protein
MNMLYSLLGWVALGFVVAWIVRRLVEPRGPKPNAQGRTYRIADNGKAITCLRCGLTSWHPEDVRQLFCGNCHIFHVRSK